MHPWNRPLLAAVKTQFQCDWNGYHGIRHWYNVLRNGENIARRFEIAGALSPDIHVVRLFALFHDAGRLNEFDDPDHGRRGAALAHRLRGKWFSCTAEQMELLAYACTHHAFGKTHADPTIGVCWDADRLDLFRVNIYPQVEYFSYPEQTIRNCPLLKAHRYARELRDRISNYC